MSEYEKLHQRISQLVERNEQLGAELECALGDLATAKGIIDRLQKDADRYQWLKEEGLHRSIDPPTAAIAPGVGPFICVQLPSSGAPTSIRLGASADDYVDRAMQKELS